MADRGYDDTGAFVYASNLLSPVNTFIFDAWGGELPLKSVYVEANAQRFTALLAPAYDDTGAHAYAAFITVAPTPKTKFEPGGVDVLPLMGYVERQTQLFSMLRGQAYSDTGAFAYASFIIPATTPKVNFGADGGRLPQGQYVEAAAARFNALLGQAYNDIGALRYGASVMAPDPLTQFSSDGGMWPLAMLRTDQRPSRMSLMFSQTEVPTPPVYYNLQVIPQVYFANCSELASVLNLIMGIVNSNVYALGVPQSYFLPMFEYISPSSETDAINIVVDNFNYLIDKGMRLSRTYNLKLFLSIPPAELTNAVNTLINEINAIFIPYIGNYISGGGGGVIGSFVLMEAGLGDVLQQNGGFIIV